MPRTGRARPPPGRTGKWARLAEETGAAFFEKHGPRAAFFARFFGPLSWVTPFFAGMHDMRYRTFFVYNTPGVALGIGQFIVAGYFFGRVVNFIPPELRIYSIGAFAALVILVVGYQIYKVVHKSRAK